MLNWNGDSVLLAIQVGFLDTNDEVNELIKVETEDEKWAWSRTTRRKNGEIVTSPRNIVDTGAFLQSISGKPLNLEVYEHRIDVPYATKVVIGGKNYPARNVFQKPMEEFPELLKKNVGKMLNEVR